jgi:hypothetical protein
MVHGRPRPEATQSVARSGQNSLAQGLPWVSQINVSL